MILIQNFGNKGEVIKYILDKYNIYNHSEVVMIGDRKYDVHGAKEVGIECIGVLYGYGTYEELYNSGADYIVKDIDELSKLIIDL